MFKKKLSAFCLSASFLSDVLPFGRVLYFNQFSFQLKVILRCFSNFLYDLLGWNGFGIYWIGLDALYCVFWKKLRFLCFPMGGWWKIFSWNFSLKSSVSVQFPPLQLFLAFLKLNIFSEIVLSAVDRGLRHILLKLEVNCDERFFNVVFFQY